MRPVGILFPATLWKKSWPQGALCYYLVVIVILFFEMFKNE